MIMINGIGVGSLRGDLGDRLVPIDLQCIDATARRLEAVLRQSWEEESPRVAGAVVDVLASTLEVLPGIELDELPRMADFARVLAAVDQVRGTRALDTYLATRIAISEQVVDGDDVATALAELARQTAPQGVIDGRAEWCGTATELLSALEAIVPIERRSKLWPKSPRQLSARLGRLGPDLARLGIDIQKPTSHKVKKLWRISLASDAGGGVGDGAPE
jgi:hypothetical protein